MALKPVRQALEARAPWKPAPYEPADAAAIQALQAGAATPAQQKRALAWIIRECCRTYDLSFRPGGPDGDRDTAFAEGRRAVGLQLVTMVNVKIGLITKREGEQP